MRILSSASVHMPAQQFAGPQPAKVLRVSGGQLFVALDAATTLEVEAKWARPLAAHSHTATDIATSVYTPADPPAGTRCLVLFAGEGVTDAWVVAWSSWPA